MRLSLTRLRGSRTSARTRRAAQGAALSLVAGTLVVLAVQYDGSPIHDVDLNDGGVWVSNSSRGMLARLNYQVEELELGVVTTSTSDRVFQEAGDVQVFDDGGGGAARSLAVVDVRSGSAQPTPMPETFESAAARSTVVVLDDATGRVWLRRSDALEGFDAAPADVKVSPRSSVTVAHDGTALVLDRAAGVATAWSLDAAGLPVQGESHEFDAELLDDPALSAVGDVPVVLQGGSLLVPGHQAVPVAGEQPVLQQVGPRADDVLVATTTDLWRFPLAGGDPEPITPLEVSGTPAAPAVVAGCTHAAWNAPGVDNYARLCAGAELFTGEIQPLTDASRLVFRSNRDLVVLNDAFAGTSWLVQQDGLTKVDNWDSVDPNAENPQEAEADEEIRSDQRNEPPTAVDDNDFGARPGSTVVLPVTLNDIDPDGDILTLKQPPASSPEATYSIVGEGTQVQAKVAPNASGTITFEYEITDGRPGNPPDKAKVNLKIYDDSVDTAPVLLKEQRNQMSVAAGREATVNVLPAWIDPEGDSLALVDAKTDGGVVGFRPDGTIDFADDGEGGASKVVEFRVSGGEAVADGKLTVRVQDPTKARPVAVADRFAGVVQSTILLEPLSNDVDPLGGQLTLPKLQLIDGGPATVTRDAERGTATFRANQPGSYYLEYVASSANGQTSDPTLIRVDVQPLSGANRPPVAARDVAAVRPGGSALVDVLANDADPDGDVLVVQGVEVSSADARWVKASLINKRFVRVEVSDDLQGRRPEVTYLLSDGRSDQVRGSVAVTVADGGANRRPTAVEDIVTVRAGTVIDIPVLENDSDPDGDKLTVQQQDLFDVDPSQPVVSSGELPVVATGSAIRVLVPDDGTTQLQIGYGVRDSDQALANQRVVLNIKPDDPEDNQAPQPRPIEDRTVTGHSIRVPVDVFGADPDGDPVVYTSLVEPPKLGRIVRSGADWFEYEPFEGPGATGTDSFKIQVTDPYGASATADVRIGVAQRSQTNQAPAALDDALLVKPGLTISYPVLQNDSDPDGDALILDEKGFHQLGSATGEQSPDSMRLDGTVVEVDVPAADAGPVETVAEYTVSDGLGGTSSAFFTVTAREDAPDHAPITQDDVADAAMLDGKAAGDTVDVDVLANDGDIDGAKSDLVLTPVDLKVATVVDRKLRITLAEESQVVPYRVTDATDQVSFGFVYVAGTANLPPTLNPDAVPVKVTAGEESSIRLADVVVVRSGHTPKVARTDQISSTNGDASASGAGDLSFLSPRSYHGPASITLGVIDGDDLNDPDGLQAQVTIPVTVEPAENVPPTVRSTSVLIYAGKEPATIDLTRLASDVNEGDELTFEVRGQGDSVSTEIKDDILSIRADDDAPSAEIDLTVAADDGTAKPVEGRVRVTVVGTKAAEDDATAVAEPLMRLRELAIPDAEVGKEAFVDLNAAILEDPIPERNEVLDVSATGPAGRPTVSGLRVSVTPDDAGLIVITYTMDDGSGQSDRRVQGRVQVTVAGPPDPPGTPQAVKGGPDSVQLTWSSPADDNGSPITGYVVRWNGGDRECPAPQCVIDGLQPGSEYRFTAEAVNAKGTSKPSPPSAPITPDEAPGQMRAPVIDDAFTDRDGKLHLRWTDPPNTGSAITGFKLTSNPATTPREVGAGEHALVWSGLDNGTSYTFTIVAVNKAGDGVPSPPSESSIPFTKPSVMAAPDLDVDAPDNTAGGYLTVSWPAVTEPENGYDSIASYDIRLLSDGQELVVKTVAGTATRESFTVDNGHSYSAQIRATNRAGTGDQWSSASSAKVAWDKAKAPTAIAKASDCVSCTGATDAYRGKVRFTTPADNGGFPVVRYRVLTEDGRSATVDAPSQAEGATVTLDVAFATNRQNQWVRLTPITRPTGQGDVAGADGQGGDFDPYAKPTPPARECAERGANTVRLCWNGGDGNGRPLAGTEYRGDASGTAAASGGSVTIRTAEGGQRRCVQARTKTGDGGWSAWSSDICESSNPKKVEVYYQQTTDIAATSCYRPCYYTKFRVEGFAPGTYSATRYGRGPGSCTGSDGGSWQITVGSDGRADVGSANKWWISYTCDSDSVTVGGITKQENIP